MKIIWNILFEMQIFCSVVFLLQRFWFHSIRTENLISQWWQNSENRIPLWFLQRRVGGTTENGKWQIVEGHFQIFLTEWRKLWPFCSVFTGSQKSVFSCWGSNRLPPLPPSKLNWDPQSLDWYRMFWIPCL